MLKPKCSVFRYIVSTRAQKANPTVNFVVFPSVKFHKIWQAGSKYFTLVRACFSGKPVRPIFCMIVKDNICKNQKSAFTNSTVFMFKNLYPSGCDVL